MQDPRLQEDLEGLKRVGLMKHLVGTRSEVLDYLA